MIGGSRRRFICKRCKKKSSDQGDTPIDSKEFGKIEFDLIDLCNKCFFETLKEYRQNTRLAMLVMQGRLKPEDLALAGRDLKYRSQLLRDNNFKEGEFASRKKVLIERLLKQTEENKKK